MFPFSFMFTLFFDVPISDRSHVLVLLFFIVRAVLIPVLVEDVPYSGPLRDLCT